MLQRFAIAALVCAPFLIACNNDTPTPPTGVALVTIPTELASAFGPITITDLGALPPSNLDSSYAYAVNDSGQIVGFSQGVGFIQHAVMWHASGTLTDLGTLYGGTYSSALAINRTGVAVGF